MTSRAEQITNAIQARAHREDLWDLRLCDVDLETMGEEIDEALTLSSIKGTKHNVLLTAEEAGRVRTALNMAVGALIADRVGDEVSRDGLRFIQDVAESALKCVGSAWVRSATPHPFATSIGGTIGGLRNEDGTWTCDCGETTPDDLSLFMHRRHDPAHKVAAT